MSSSTSRHKTSRKYAFACSQCRQKKLQCDGKQPTCRRCLRANTTCLYPQKATESQLKEANARIEQLEAELAVATDSLALDSSTRAPANPSDTVCEQEDISPHVGFDEHGLITYHGPTSRFSDSGLTDGQLRHVLQPPPRISRAQHVAALQSNYGMLNEVWEPLLESKTAQDLGAEPSLVRRLLNLFWIWQYPLHNYLYKPCFIMDMALGGPYFSKFLLHSILALSARHLDTESADNEGVSKGETFLSSAKQLLVHELAATKPRIPTIQGLLILSGRQCAVGKTSEGWLYAGMAIRMLTDLGLHLNFQHLMHLETFSPVDLEIRKRLYSSAYIWDKSLSLSLGRPPSLQRLPPTAFDFWDHTDDQYAWAPEEFPDYPTAVSYQTTCFTFFCRLGPIIEQILLPLSSRTSLSELNKRLTSIENRLFVWHNELPPILKIAADCDTCPPTHILSLNMLYHALHIILWRPSLDFNDQDSHAAKVCVTSAQIVHDLFLLFGRTFQWQKMSYLVSYCVYTAATVHVREMNSANVQRRQVAAKHLAAALQVLESESRQTPGIRRSINIIKRQLRTWTPGVHGDPSHANTVTEETSEQDPALHRDFMSGTPRIRQSFGAHGPNLNQDQANANAEHQNNCDPDNVWNPQQYQMHSEGEESFGLEFMNTSAGFYVPFSLDDTSSFGFLDAPLFTDSNNV